MKVPKRIWVVVNDRLDPNHKNIAAAARTKKRALEICEDEGDEVIGPFILHPNFKRTSPVRRDGHKANNGKDNA